MILKQPIENTTLKVLCFKKIPSVIQQKQLNFWHIQKCYQDDHVKQQCKNKNK